MLKKNLLKYITDEDILHLYKSKCKITNPNIMKQLVEQILFARNKFRSNGKDKLANKQNRYGNSGKYFASLIKQKRERQRRADQIKELSAVKSDLKEKKAWQPVQPLIWAPGPDLVQDVCSDPNCIFCPGARVAGS